eukprot:gene7635-5490_t
MSSRRSANSLPSLNGGSDASPEASFRTLLEAHKATFLLDPTVLPTPCQEHAEKWATALANAYLISTEDTASLPDAFEPLSSNGQLRVALQTANKSVISACLTAAIFHSEQVQLVTSAPSKVLAAFCNLTGPGRSSTTYKKVCQTVSKVINEPTFELREFILGLNPTETEAQALNGLFASKKESAALQAILLMTLLKICFPAPPVADEAPSLPTDALTERLSQAASVILTPAPNRKPKKAAASAPPAPPRASQPLNDSFEVEALKARIKLLEAQMNLNAPAAGPPSAQRQPRSNRGPPSEPNRKRRAASSPDASSSDSSDDEGSVIDVTNDGDIDSGAPYMGSTMQPPSSLPPGTFPPFSFHAEPRGTYADLHNRVKALPTTEHHIPRFHVSTETTTSLLNSFNTLCQSRIRGSVPTIAEVLMLVYHRTTSYKVGVAIIDITGIPHHFFRSRKPDTTSPPSIATVFNPSAIVDLECLGEPLIARHIFPVSPDHWRVFLRSTLIKAVADPVPFQAYSDAPSGQSRVRMLEAYSQRFRQLIHSTLGASWRDHKYHVSIWAHFLIFHLGRWVHATVLRRLDLLLDNFDREWETHYAVKLKDTTYLANVFPQCLELLDYRCPKGHRGYCELACDICDRAPASAHDTDDTDHRKLVDAWHRAYTTWVADARKKGLGDTSHKAYEKESPYPKPSTSTRRPRIDRRSLAHTQNRVTPPPLYDLLD